MKHSLSFFLIILVTLSCNVSSLFGAAALPYRTDQKVLTAQDGEQFCLFLNARDSLSKRTFKELIENERKNSFVRISYQDKSTGNVKITVVPLDRFRFLNLETFSHRKGTIIGHKIFSVDPTQSDFQGPYAMEGYPQVMPSVPVEIPHVPAGYQGPYAIAEGSYPQGIPTVPMGYPAAEAMPVQTVFPEYQGPYAMGGAAAMGGYPQVMPPVPMGYPAAEAMPVQTVLPGYQGPYAMGDAPAMGGYPQVMPAQPPMPAREGALHGTPVTAATLTDLILNGAPAQRPVSPTLDQMNLEIARLEREEAKAEAAARLKKLQERKAARESRSGNSQSSRDGRVREWAAEVAEAHQVPSPTKPAEETDPQVTKYTKLVVKKAMPGAPAAGSGPANTIKERPSVTEKPTLPKEKTDRTGDNVVAAAAQPSSAADASSTNNGKKNKKKNSSVTATEKPGDKIILTRPKAPALEATDGNAAAIVEKLPVAEEKQEHPAAAAKPLKQKLSKAEINALKQQAFTDAKKCFAQNKYQDALDHLVKANPENKEVLLLRARCLHTVGKRLHKDDSKKLKKLCKGNYTRENRKILAVYCNLPFHERWELIAHDDVANCPECIVERVTLLVHERSLGQEKVCSCSNGTANKLCQHEKALKLLEHHSYHPEAAEQLLLLYLNKEIPHHCKRAERTDIRLALIKECIETLQATENDRYSALIRDAQELNKQIETEQFNKAQAKLVAARKKAEEKEKEDKRNEAAAERKEREQREKEEAEAKRVQSEKKAKKDAAQRKKDAVATKEKEEEQRKKEEAKWLKKQAASAVPARKSAYEQLLDTSTIHSPLEQWKLCLKAEEEKKKSDPKTRAKVLLLKGNAIRNLPDQELPEAIRCCSDVDRAKKLCCKHEKAILCYREVIKITSSQSEEAKRAKQDYAYMLMQMLQQDAPFHRDFLKIEDIIEVLGYLEEIKNSHDPESNDYQVSNELFVRLESLKNQLEERTCNKVKATKGKKVNIKFEVSVDELNRQTISIATIALSAELAKVNKYLEEEKHKLAAGNLKEITRLIQQLESFNDPQLDIDYFKFQFYIHLLKYFDKTKKEKFLNYDSQTVKFECDRITEKLHDKGKIETSEIWGKSLIKECELEHDASCVCGYEKALDLWKKYDHPTLEMLTTNYDYWLKSEKYKTNPDGFYDLLQKISVHPHTSAEKKVELRLQIALERVPHNHLEQLSQEATLKELGKKYPKITEQAYKKLIEIFITRNDFSQIKTFLNETENEGVKVWYTEAVTELLKEELKKFKTLKEPTENHKIFFLIHYKHLLRHEQIIATITDSQKMNSLKIKFNKHLKGFRNKLLTFTPPPFSREEVAEWFALAPEDEKRIQTDHPDFYLWYRAAETEKDEQKLEEAIDLYQQAYDKAEVKHPAFACYLGAALVKKGESSDKILALLNEGKTYNPAEAAKIIANIHIKKGEYNKAYAVFEELGGSIGKYHQGAMILHGVSPKVKSIQCTKSDPHAECSHTAAFKHWEEHCIKEGEEHPEALRTMAKWLLFGIGVPQDVHKAIEFARKAYELTPDQTISVITLSNCLRVLPEHTEESYDLLTKTKSPFYAEYAIRIALERGASHLPYISELLQDSDILKATFTDEKARKEAQKTVLETLPRWEECYMSTEHKKRTGTIVEDPGIIPDLVDFLFKDDLSNIEPKHQAFISTLKSLADTCLPRDLDDHPKKCLAAIATAAATHKVTEVYDTLFEYPEPMRSDLVNSMLKNPQRGCRALKPSMIPYLEDNYESMKPLLMQQLPVYLAILRVAFNYDHQRNHGMPTDVSALKTVFGIINLLKQKGEQGIELLERDFLETLFTVRYSWEEADIQKLTEQDTPLLSYIETLLKKVITKKDTHPLDLTIAMLLLPSFQHICEVCTGEEGSQQNIILTHADNVCLLLDKAIVITPPPAYLKSHWTETIESFKEVIRQQKRHFRPLVAITEQNGILKVSQQLNPNFKPIPTLTGAIEEIKAKIGDHEDDKDPFVNQLALSSLEAFASIYQPTPNSDLAVTLSNIILKIDALNRNFKNDDRCATTVEQVTKILDTIIASELELGKQKVIFEALERALSSKFYPDITLIADILCKYKEELAGAGGLNHFIYDLYFYAFSCTLAERETALFKIANAFPLYLESKEVHRDNHMVRIFKLKQPQCLSKNIESRYTTDRISLRFAVARGGEYKSPKDAVPLLTKAWKKGMRLLVKEDQEDKALIPCIMSESRTITQMKCLLEAWKIVVEQHKSDETYRTEIAKANMLIKQLTPKQ